MDTVDQALAHDREALLKVMNERGFVLMAAEFSGSGDEGWIQTAEFFVADAEQPAYSSRGQQWMGGGEVRDAALDQLAYAYCDALIDGAGIAGYENNEGGGGTISLDARERKESIDSYYYVEETTDGPSAEREF